LVPFEEWDFDYKNILPFVDVFMPNEAELLNIAKTNNIEEAVEKLRPYSNNIIIKRGSKGSILHTSLNGAIEKSAYLNTEVVDAIGAGDSFNAGFINKFVKGESLENCLDFGNLTGALNTTAAGGTGAFSSKEQIKQTLKNKFNISVNL